MQIDIRHVSKRFGSVLANREVSLTVEAGSIHGLLGENGAGKSTLVKILSGFLRHDGGEICLDRIPVEFGSPAEAIGAGIGMLHQDPLDFPALSVLDNFIAGRPGSVFLDRRQARQQLYGWAQDLGFELDPDRRVEELTVGERQHLELSRLLSLGVKALILDEPTTGISARQKDVLFSALKRLAGQGRAILFVSHKLEDVEILCDRATVMRQGRVVGQVEIPCAASLLVDLMFGQELAAPIKPDLRQESIALRTESLKLTDERLPLPVPGLRVQRGEVIGLAGLEGSGQRALLLACAGLAKAEGQIWIGGQDLSQASYRDHLRAGVRYLPADRRREGLIPGLSIRDHVALQYSAQLERGLSRSLGVIDRGAVIQKAQAAIDRLRIRGQRSTRVEHLSGGNQQRTQLALLPDAIEVLLMEHPTRGLDLESSLWVWQQLIDRCRMGTAILFTSSDLDEIVQYSDRIMVFSSGWVSEPIETAQLTVERLGEQIGGRFDIEPMDQIQVKKTTLSWGQPGQAGDEIG